MIDEEMYPLVMPQQWTLKQLANRPKSCKFFSGNLESFWITQREDRTFELTRLVGLLLKHLGALNHGYAWTSTFGYLHTLNGMLVTEDPEEERTLHISVQTGFLAIGDKDHAAEAFKVDPFGDFWTTKARCPHCKHEVYSRSVRIRGYVSTPEGNGYRFMEARLCYAWCPGCHDLAGQLDLYRPKALKADLELLEDKRGSLEQI